MWGRSCIDAAPLPAGLLQSRLEWLNRCVWAEGRVSEEVVKHMLEGGGGLAEGWEVSTMQWGGLLAVAPTTMEVEEEVKAGFILSNGILLRVVRWGLLRGMHLDPRACRLTIHLAGVPLVLCDKLGISSLPGSFGAVVSSSVRVLPVKKVSAMEADVLVCSPKAVPAIIVADVAGQHLLIPATLQPAGS